LAAVELGLLELLMLAVLPARLRVEEWTALQGQELRRGLPEIRERPVREWCLEQQVSPKQAQSREPEALLVHRDAGDHRAWDVIRVRPYQGDLAASAFQKRLPTRRRRSSRI
jgi:hypothetical protein